MIPLAVTGYFGLQHAVGPLLRDTVGHNLLPGLGLWGQEPLRPWLFPLSLPLVWLASRFAAAGATSRTVAFCRSFLLSAGLFYVAVLYCGSPVVGAESWQPVLPFVGLFAAALTSAGRRFAACRCAAPTCSAAGPLAGSWRSRWRIVWPRAETTCGAS